MPLRLCLGMSTIVGLFVAFGDARISGFWFTLWAVVALCGMPGMGVWLGYVIRKLIMPDAVYGSTGYVIKARLFWACVPQFIGWFIGMMDAMGALGIRG
ncbi:permease [Salmonella enterica]|uniref:Permease n=1 Tax=Salmonella enterica subsp. enterica serovar Rough O:d:1,7 TaxID=1974323 RepID=A0A974QCG1_SALET|nr:permease [Salmonella enterica]EBW8396387.1 permease [Salmonella enterica subsp. enterica serovar Florida]ECC9940597.1 permease [Salmonella enterica subsp. enterica]ECD7245032.1 permease [Salmonella enterica subsp. enterica serovar Florida]ECF4168427.1 permease [Salmonella enterica subsp. enterica serovar Florida]ECW2477247.1 permease [Salmonella enterica subsp. enterica serovar Florida]